MIIHSCFLFIPYPFLSDFLHVFIEQDKLYEFRSLLHPHYSSLTNHKLNLVALKVRDPKDFPRQVVAIVHRAMYDILDPKKVRKKEDQSPPINEYFINYPSILSLSVS